MTHMPRIFISSPPQKKLLYPAVNEPPLWEFHVGTSYPACPDRSSALEQARRGQDLEEQNPNVTGGRW